MTTTITPDHIVVRNKDQVTAGLGGGRTALMSVEKGYYYHLNGVGGRIWDLLAEPVSISTMRETLTAEYEISSQQAERDIIDYVKQLLGEGLVCMREPDLPGRTD